MTKRPKRYKIRGKEYTVSEIEKAFGVSANNFRQRMRLGFSLDECLSPTYLYKLKRYEIRGKTYLAKEIEAAFGVPETRFRSRIKNGYTPEEAVTPGVLPRQRNPKRYKIHGKHYSAKEVEDFFGIPRALFLERVKKGYTPEVASAHRRLPRLVHQIGKKKYTTKEVEAEFGIRAGAFLQRLKRGMSPKQAVETPSKRLVHRIGNKKYTTKEVEAEFGINAATFLQRLRKGLSPQQAVTAPLRHRRSYHINGKDYTVEEVEAKFNIRAGTFLRRLREGMSPKQAVEKPVRPLRPGKRGALHRIDGKDYTVKEVEAEFDIRADTFLHRLRDGMSPKEAVEKPVRSMQPSRRGALHRIDGKDYTVEGVEAEFDIRAGTFLLRLRKGMSPKEAAEKPVRPLRPYRIDGKDYTAKEVEAEFNIRADTFMHRLRDGMSPKQAVETPLRSMQPSRRGALHRIDGKDYTTKEVETAFNIRADTFLLRLKKGMSPKQAAEKPVRPLRPYRIDGKGYTAKEVEVEFNIRADTFLHRLRDGMSPKQAVETPLRSRRPSTLIIAGKEITYEEAGQLFDMSPEILSLHVKEKTLWETLNSKMPPCPVCGLRYRPQGLRNHLRTHGEENET